MTKFNSSYSYAAEVAENFESNSFISFQINDLKSINNFTYKNISNQFTQLLLLKCIFTFHWATSTLSGKRAHVLPIITWPLGDTLAVDDAIDTPHEDIFVIPDSWDFTFEFPPNWSDTNNIQLHSTAYDSTQTRRRKESPMKKTNSTF